MGATMRSIRGAEMSMIFQEPMTSLNPSYTIGDQIMEAILLHQGVDKEEPRSEPLTSWMAWAWPTQAWSSSATRTN
jgi:ABC-type microcin C transport system duplicated ATPase subunit YejF